ncbi:hypothetical protein RN001_010423 [Aquatica leii]|uniref:Kelch-like protein diablo n=1 Tax=Aquatica leii TaxID=1421715 RepID=A0AAN7P6J0_9COLE|nr:hypothetical protein RN001_010423 [Aquatica leii]
MCVKFRRLYYFTETEELQLPTTSTTPTSSVVFEASTQTPTSENCDSPLVSPKGNYSLTTSDHSNNALTNIYKMRQHGQLCDITLHVGLEIIRAHKVVLASISPYFFAMFNGDMKEQSCHEIILHDMDPAAVELLIEYGYTGQIVITPDNVQVLLPASSILQMSTVREACCRFLMKQLHPTNCLGIRSFADTHSCKELHRRSHCFALQNFQQVVATEEFLLLPQLNICSEEDVFTAVLNWVKHDLSDRKQYVAQLMEHVRLPLVNREFLMTRVDCEKLVREDSQCRELLLEAMRYHLAPERRCVLSTPRTLERKPKGAESYLFAVGGGSLFAIHSECEVYNPRSDAWSAIAPMQWRRSRCGVTGLRRMLYVCYNPLINNWSGITPMGTKRSCLGICAFDGLIYVCGGYDGASCLSSMERFDPLTGIWCSCPAMNTRRRYCRVAVVENCIYALGGFDSTNYQASVERYDPRQGSWHSIPSMSSRRSSCGVAAVDGYLYCIGGNDGTMCMSSGERFNVRRNVWEPITAMHNRRSTHEVVGIGGCVYALGGNDGSSSLNSLEMYDPQLNKWALLSSMVTRRSSVGAAVLECINIEHVLRATKC